MGEGVIIGRGWPSDWSLVRYDAFDRPLGAAPRCDWGRGTHASAAPEVPSPSVLAWTRRQARRPLRRFFAQHPNGCSGIAHLLILSALAAPQSGAAPLECPAPHHWGALLPYGFCMEREGYFPLSSVGHCRWGPSLLRVGVGAYLSPRARGGRSLPCHRQKKTSLSCARLCSCTHLPSAGGLAKSKQPYACA